MNFGAPPERIHTADASRYDDAVLEGRRVEERSAGIKSPQRLACFRPEGIKVAVMDSDEQFAVSDGGFKTRAYPLADKIAHPRYSERWS